MPVLGVKVGAYPAELCIPGPIFPLTVASGAGGVDQVVLTTPLDVTTTGMGETTIG